ncbi:MAG TPA: metalloregulator ArsR/SmtB family transcription factor [Anaerolineae bacterium]|nr:metalloregulator ArsR/SmtB family transcription factor [Anaerolineae bacterium]
MVSIERLVEVFKVLGDTTRLKIVKLLSERELRVGEIVEILGLAQSSVSQHLARLRSAKLVNERREGQVVYYALNRENFWAFEKSCKLFMESELASIKAMEHEYQLLQTIVGDRKGDERKLCSNV